MASREEIVLTLNPFFLKRKNRFACIHWSHCFNRFFFLPILALLILLHSCWFVSKCFTNVLLFIYFQFLDLVRRGQNDSLFKSPTAEVASCNNEVAQSTSIAAPSAIIMSPLPSSPVVAPFIASTPASTDTPKPVPAVHSPEPVISAELLRVHSSTSVLPGMSLTIE